MKNIDLVLFQKNTYMINEKYKSVFVLKNTDMILMKNTDLVLA